jgi:hypothetical protein
MIDPLTQWPDSTPDDPRLYVPNIEFYITNVCNITCTNCNRYNNYDFAGWQRWSDYETQYEAWAEKIRIQKITILGGEPLLNPTIVDWVRGLNRIWKKRVQILTNGTRLNQVPGLYDLMREFKQPNEGPNWIGVSVHNINELDQYFAEIRKFLKGSITEWQGRDTVDSRGGSATWGADYAFVDENDVHVHVWVYDSFYNVSVHRNQQGLLTLHNNDPQQAHDVCGMVKFKNYHFIQAKLYKCGPVALMPEFDRQHPLVISDEDRDLLNSYHALSVEEFDHRGQDFLANIDQVIPQCKFCPTKFVNQQLFATSKLKNATTIFRNQ